MPPDKRMDSEGVKFSKPDPVQLKSKIINPKKDNMMSISPRIIPRSKLKILSNLEMDFVFGSMPKLDANIRVKIAISMV